MRSFNRFRFAKRLALVVLASTSVRGVFATPQDAPRIQHLACRDSVNCSDSQNAGATKDPRKQPERKKPKLVDRWLALAERAQAEQPDWLSPLVTASGRLKQEFRYDIWEQPAAGGNHMWQFSGSKGLEFLITSRTQLVFRRLLERLSEGELLAIDRDPDQEVQNCSVTWYAFDATAGTRGKMVLKEFNGIHYQSGHRV